MEEIMDLGFFIKLIPTEAPGEGEGHTLRFLEQIVIYFREG